MITGFNTDVQHEGVTYHVQTEDKGLDSPLILSLVYVGGAIIASKRTPYEDLVGQGFDEQALTERLQRQHKLICAAIKAGRVEDLKRMGAAQNGGAQPPEPESEPNGVAVAAPGRKAGGQRRKKAEAAPAPPVEEAPVAVEVPSAVEVPPLTEETGPPPAFEAATPLAEPAPDEPPAATPAEAEVLAAEPEMVILTTLAEEVSALPPPPAPETTVAPPPAQENVDAASGEQDAAAPPETPLELAKEIYLSLLDDEGEFRAGQLVTIKVYVGRGAYGQRPATEASVTVKVLGTAFRPIILNATTDAQGVGVVRTLLPRFTSGRAAIIIRAVLGEASAEMRRIIHQ